MGGGAGGETFLILVVGVIGLSFSLTAWQDARRRRELTEAFERARSKEATQ